jgi:sugar phosphate permease
MLMLCQSTQSILGGGLALFLPLIRRSLHLTFAEAGALSSASILVYACMQIPSGHLADRIGPRRLFLVGLVGTNVLSLTFSQVHSFGWAVANQAASGFFRSLVFAPGLLLIASLFSPERRATALGLYVAGGFSSNIFVNTLGPVLVEPLGWRAMFVLFSVFGLLVFALYALFGEREDARPTTASAPWRDGLRLLRTRTMWLIAGVQYVRFAVVTGITLWLPTFFVVEKHRSLAFAGLIVALCALLTAPSNFVGGYLSDRLRNPLLVIGCSLFMLAVTTFVLARANGVAVLVAAALLNAVFLQLYFGPLFALPIDLFGRSNAGLASGFGNTFANVGGLTFAYTLGAIRDATGSFDLGFYALCCLAAVGVGLTLMLARAVPTRQPLLVRT